MQSIIDALSKNISASLASVYTIYATTFAALAIVIAFIQIHRDSPIYTYKIGDIWPIRMSICIALISIVSLQVTSLLIIILDLKNSCTSYIALKTFLVFSWLSLLMLGIIYHIVLRVADQVLKNLTLSKE